MADFKNYLSNLSQNVFKHLLTEEEADFFVHSEESQFVRFNRARVRQNTFVRQHELSFRLQAHQRTLRVGLNLTLDFESDLKNILAALIKCREQLVQIDPHPQYVPLVNNGQSESFKKVKRPNDEEMLKIILDNFSQTDMAGLYCSGPVRKISINSKGQSHYFENDFFFLDYSIYKGPKAAKGFYSSEVWDEKDLIKNIKQTKNKLQLLNKPIINVPKGQYRVYLEPMAMQEITWTLNWGGFSYAALKQGRSPIKRFHQYEVALSEKLSLIENLNLGYVPLFNSIGEMAQKEIPLIKNGLSQNLLISSATAQEYGVASNQAEFSENLRSLEIKPGNLKAQDILKELDTGLYLSNLHYLNWSDRQSARITGMTRYACFWVEKGVIKGPISDLRFDDSVYSLFGTNLLDLTSHQELFVESATYQKRSLGATKLPGALIENFNFTL